MELRYIIIIVAIVFLLLLALGLAIVNFSSDDMVEKFKQANKYLVMTSPVQFVQTINKLHFKNSIKLKFNDKYFSDSYNGSTRTLTLSSKYAHKNELAGLAISAHELGHAIQFKEQPNLMKKHAKKLKLSKAVSWLISPLFIIAMVCLAFSKIYLAIGFAVFGVVVFLIAIITKFSTLKIEKDASIKAMELLEEHACLHQQELNVARELLNSAKQTYLADVLKTMLKWTMLVKK